MDVCDYVGELWNERRETEYIYAGRASDGPEVQFHGGGEFVVAAKARERLGYR